MGQGESAHHKELQYVVQTGGVAHPRLYDRRDLLDVAQGTAVKHTLPCLHPSPVAADGVDLSVMGQQAEGLG